RAATVAVRILHGESPGDIKTPPQRAAAPVYDWRELQRWNIPEDRLPRGSIVRFREPSTWRRYFWYIVGIGSLCLVEAVLILALEANRVRRARAERSARESEERFRLVANSAPVMIWMSGLDQLCTYFNQGWLQFTGRSLEAELGNGWVE